MKRFLLMAAVWVAIASAATAAPSYLGDMGWTRGASGATWQEWSFDDDDNPAVPENSSNPYGTPTAALSGDGLAHWASYAGHEGVWHAGSALDDRLIIQLSIPNNEVLNDYKELWLEAIFLVDAEYAGVSPSFAATTPPGVQVELLDSSIAWEDGWRRGVWHWRLSPNPFNETICLYFTGTGGLIDWIAVDTICTTAVPVPGAVLLGSIGVGLVGWMRRRHAL